MFVYQCSKTPNVYVGLLYSFRITVRSTSYDGSNPQGELAIEAFKVFILRFFKKKNEGSSLF